MRQIPKEMLREAERNVTIVNASDERIRMKFDGSVYEFPPKSYDDISTDRAWLWFGDVRDRSDPRLWNREMLRVKHAHGDRIWEELLLTGKFYVMDWAEQYGYGRDFYAHTHVPEAISQIAKPLSPEMMDMLLAQQKAPAVADHVAQPLPERMATPGLPPTLKKARAVVETPSEPVAKPLDPGEITPRDMALAAEELAQLQSFHQKAVARS